MTDLERNKRNVTAFYDLMFNQGRPREAIELGAAEEVLHLDRIAEGITRLVREQGPAVLSTAGAGAPRHAPR